MFGVGDRERGRKGGREEEREREREREMRTRKEGREITFKAFLFSFFQMTQ
jgi:hypothetical protein